MLRMMPRVCVFLMMAASWMLPNNTGASSALPSDANPTRSPITIPAPPALSAPTYVLIDQRSGQTLVQKDPERRVEPASLTKMMTIYVVDQALQAGRIQLGDLVNISEKAWRATGSRMFVNVNTQVRIEDLRRGVIVQSGNDASIALAEHLAGSEEAFSGWMNEQAAALGLRGTHFVNATGLPDPLHYSTAADMALLAQALIRDFPESYRLYAEKEFVYQNIRQENRNRLLWRNELVDGIKTGHTDNAGYCLVASGQKDQTRLIAVLMGAESDKQRIEESNQLLNYGFRFFETRKLYAANTPLTQSRIWLGTEKTLALGLSEDLYVTVPVGQEVPMPSLTIAQTIKAPASMESRLGTLVLKRGDQIIAQRPLIALKEVALAGFFSRSWDRVHLSAYQLWDKAVH